MIYFCMQSSTSYRYLLFLYQISSLDLPSWRAVELSRFSLSAPLRDPESCTPYPEAEIPEFQASALQGCPVRGCSRLGVNPSRQFLRHHGCRSHEDLLL